MFRNPFRKAHDPEMPDLSALAADMHSHLIPGIDDGAKTAEESISLIRRFAALGYRKLITTPHVNSRFRNTPEIILGGMASLQQALTAEHIDIEVMAAAEYQIEDGFDKLMKEGHFLTFGENYLLIELSYFVPHPALSEIIYELQSAGYNLILAHAERYAYWHHNLKMPESLIDRDVHLQVNLSSLSGSYGHEVRQMARTLISRGWVEFAGSDVHNQAYMDNFIKGACDKYSIQLIGSGRLRNHLPL